jgi:penicillin-insensitive murein endopeptidase
MSATNLVRPDRRDVDPSAYTPAHVVLLKAVAKEREVARIFVNPAIKRALCRDAGADRAWLSKIRPMFGHNYHFHIRLWCPPGDEGCADQEPPAPGDGCGAELDRWFSDEMLHPKPGGKPRPPMLMAQLPAECRKVLVAK